ncbi:hypothetical protein FQN53_008054 [Emmonsiellopsis sp. PD_33]|nr:hypothetical protein FQN53_008054 [Emmonsiellopsis sp. PD_33]
MSPKHNPTPFKVLIAGGGLAGLSLANMLQQHGIDYLLLEAYADITPQAGASIGFLPHGLRILDQLGMYDDFREGVVPIDSFSFRDGKGRLLAEHGGVEGGLVERVGGRHGYPMIFLERRAALGILYKYVDKGKVLTGKAVRGVELLDHCVKVTTGDGGVYTGDILVGCDGVHSIVRQEMVRLASERAPGYFPPDEFKSMVLSTPTWEYRLTVSYQGVPCDYGCLFGISASCAAIKPGTYTGTFSRYPYLLLGAPDRVFWFHFFKLDKRYYGDDIPKFTEEQKAGYLKAREEDIIAPGLKFGDLAKKKVTCGITALPEFTFEQWHYDRIMTIGDAAHKFHPLTGHGGNSALEAAAALTNRLVKALDESSGTLTASQVSSVFQKVRDSRHDRIKGLVKTSHEHQRLVGLENPFLKFVALHVLPRANTDYILYEVSRYCPQAETLDGHKHTIQPLLVPYHSDLLSAPYNRSWRGWVLAALFLALSFVGYWALQVWAMRIGASHLFDKIHVVPYTDIPSIDGFMSLFAPQYAAGNRSLPESHSALQFYFLISLFPMIAIYTVESVRKRNRMNLLAITSCWALYQGLSIALLGPLYYAAYIFASRNENYWWPLSRRVPICSAKALLPSLVLGYLIPTLLLFIPYSNPRTGAIIVLFWQFSPIYVNILLFIFSEINATLSPDDDHKTPTAAKPLPDIPHLKRVYMFSFILATATHIFTLLRPISLAAIFIPYAGHSQHLSFAEGIRSIWIVDFWVYFVATLVWAVVAVWDMKRVGRAGTDLGKAVVVIVLGAVVVGPAATTVGVWWWREGVMARVVFG